MPTWSMLSFQDSASPLMEELIYFHDFSMMILIMITVLVGVNMFLLVYYELSNRYLLQNQTIEMLWTTLPIFILFAVAAPSLKILYLIDDPFMPNLTVKATGHQWYWSYEYSDFPDLEFDSYMITMLQGSMENNRLLETDNNLVMPSGTNSRLIVTAADVIHAWSIPALGVKVDAVPGRLNQLMFSIKRPGLFYGQCSEICGANHSFMPIKLEVVPINNFTNWVKIMS